MTSSLPLTRLALESRPILEVLETGQVASTIDGFAKQLDRDPSNLRRSLKALVAEGWLKSSPEAGRSYALTEAGSRALAGLRVAEGAASAGLPPLTRDQIFPDPDQPRKDFDPDGLLELAESIADRGLQQPILVRMMPDGSAQLVAGERRWRAIGQLISAGDPRWPVDRPVPYHLSTQADAAEILADQVVENVQRAGLHPLEEAEAFQTLKATHGWGVGRIAKTVGKTRRFVEQRLDLLLLTPAQRDRMRLPRDHADHLTASRAREMVQHLREISAAQAEQRDIEEVAPGSDVAAVSAASDASAGQPKLTPRELLVLGEIAAAAAARPSTRFPAIPGFPAPTGPIVDVNYAEASKDEDLRNLAALDLVDFCIRGGFHPADRYAGAMVDESGHLRLRLANLHPDDSPRSLFHLRREAGLSADQARQLQKLGQWATPWLNIADHAGPAQGGQEQSASPLSRAEWLSEAVTAPILAASRAQPGHERDICARVSGLTTVEGETWPEEAGERLRTPWKGYPSVEIRLTTSSQGRWHATLATTCGPPSYAGQGEPPYVYTNDPLFRSRADALAYAIDRAVKQLGADAQKRQVRAWLAGIQQGEPAGPAEPPAAPAGDEFRFPVVQADSPLVWTKPPLAHDAGPRGELTEPQIRILCEVNHAQLSSGTSDPIPVGQYWLDADAVALWKRPAAPLLLFSAPPGGTWTVQLTEAGLAGVQLLNGELDPLALAMRIDREGYSCAWLRPAETPIGDQLGQVESAAGLDFEEESQLLIDARAEMAAGAPDPEKLLALVGLVGEFAVGGDAQIELKPRGGGRIVTVAVADPDREEPEDLALARAELIAFALNALTQGAAGAQEAA